MANLSQALERARGAAGAFAHSRRQPRRRPRFAAEMRALRSQLQPLLDERRPATLGVTACGHGEGATTVVNALASALAQDHTRVLLCGFSAAAAKGKPAVTPDPPNGPRPIAKTSYDALRFVDVSDLHGQDSANTAKIGFRAWLDTVKPHFDVVLLDMPPLLDQPNWSPLLRSQDGLILVVEAERTRNAVLDATVSAIQSAGGHILGIVFNRRRRYIPRFLYRLL